MARGRHYRLLHRSAAGELVDQSRVASEFVPGQAAVGREPHPDAVDMVSDRLRRIGPGESFRTGHRGQGVEHEAELEAVAGAELAAIGRRAPVELVEMGAAAMLLG